VRECEDDVEVLDVDNLPLASLQPSCSCRALTLRTMSVATRVVDADPVVALVALFDVAAEDRRSALNELSQNSTLRPRGTIAFRVRRSVLSDNIGHFRPMFAHRVGVV